LGVKLHFTHLSDCITKKVSVGGYGDGVGRVGMGEC
jgi:hypothetical protein